MNGLEALENWYNTEQPKPVEYCFHYNIIKKELKVNRILKEKRVNLQFISYKVLGRGYSAQEVLEEYNAFAVLNELKLEEMQLIVNWLKGE